MIFMALFKKSAKKEVDQKILIAYGEALGIFDVWQLSKVKNKFSLERTIVVVKRNPPTRLFRKPTKMALKSRFQTTPKNLLKC
ncbi:MAG: hypothetical protein QI199_06665 [Candidatus Korarchaeota archaeon]|nr:hypothetical protein [Candidatus Korarchaeota archaeon]